MLAVAFAEMWPLAPRASREGNEAEAKATLRSERVASSSCCRFWPHRHVFLHTFQEELTENVLDTYSHAMKGDLVNVVFSASMHPKSNIVEPPPPITVSMSMSCGIAIEFSAMLERMW